MNDKLDAYSDVLRQLVYEMEACSPHSWERGELSIQSDGARLAYSLRNEGHPDRATLTDELRKAIDALFVKMRQNGDAWTAARIRWWVEGGAIRFDTGFDYIQNPAPKRSWWRR
jgi:hypothetical protein